MRQNTKDFFIVVLLTLTFLFFSTVLLLILLSPVHNDLLPPKDVKNLRIFKVPNSLKPTSRLSLQERLLKTSLEMKASMMDSYQLYGME